MGKMNGKDLRSISMIPCMDLPGHQTVSLMKRNSMAAYLVLPLSYVSIYDSGYFKKKWSSYLISVPELFSPD